ncbi:HAUS augmin-like complex subunit 6 N-terminus-domain-containing protein [Rhizopus microsporus]|uniref:HAUS augmin-like complex subunit 6 N-terminal domain-containing protein n=1 Tax=Rhizopus microsporus TaxID=58291 RepID=A0A1X0RYX5_RHIZD|nr:hypothetical protein BCV71DRAFT_291734 [Rhizopus microsporus]
MLFSPIIVFLSNLKTLGFDQSVHCKGIYSKVVVDPSTFVLYNRSFEVTSYFLFRCYDKSLAKKEFKGCFPPKTKQQAREYVNIAFRLLQDIRQTKKNSILAHIPLRRSYFDNYRSEIMGHVMLAFSTVVLETVLSHAIEIKTDFLDKETLENEIQNLSDEVVEKTQHINTLKKEWREEGLKIVEELDNALPKPLDSKKCEELKIRLEKSLNYIQKTKLSKSKTANSLGKKLAQMITSPQDPDSLFILPKLPQLLLLKRSTIRSPLPETPKRETYPNSSTPIRTISQSGSPIYTRSPITPIKREAYLSSSTPVRERYSSSLHTHSPISSPKREALSNNNSPIKTISHNDSHLHTRSPISSPQKEAYHNNSTPVRRISHNDLPLQIRSPISSPQREAYPSNNTPIRTLFQSKSPVYTRSPLASPARHPYSNTPIRNTYYTSGTPKKEASSAHTPTRAHIYSNLSIHEQSPIKSPRRSSYSNNDGPIRARSRSNTPIRTHPYSSTPIRKQSEPSFVQEMQQIYEDIERSDHKLNKSNNETGQGAMKQSFGNNEQDDQGSSLLYDLESVAYLNNEEPPSAFMYDGMNTPPPRPYPSPRRQMGIFPQDDILFDLNLLTPLRNNNESASRWRTPNRSVYNISTSTASKMRTQFY